MTDPSTHEPSRRSFLRKMAIGGFSAPVVATFGLQSVGVASAQTPDDSVRRASAARTTLPDGTTSTSTTSPDGVTTTTTTTPAGSTTTTTVASSTTDESTTTDATTTTTSDPATTTTPAA